MKKSYNYKGRDSFLIGWRKLFLINSCSNCHGHADCCSEFFLSWAMNVDVQNSPLLSLAQFSSPVCRRFGGHRKWASVKPKVSNIMPITWASPLLIGLYLCCYLPLPLFLLLLSQKDYIVKTETKYIRWHAGEEESLPRNTKSLQLCTISCASGCGVAWDEATCNGVFIRHCQCVFVEGWLQTLKR